MHKTTAKNRPNWVFKKLALSENPIMLSPLAGVSDHPFRRICAREGAELTYVEMLSAIALLNNNQRTRDMLTRHPEEKRLGVQLTGRNADEVAKAVEVLNQFPFETVDLNMGCPVRKVIKGGSGSAILKDPERVYQTVLQARNATDRPVSAKIRLGWDHKSINAIEVGQAAEAAGAAWLTIHGRTRADDYSAPVDLERIAEVKAKLKIPVIGNGNIFSKEDADYMLKTTGVDGIMIGRGALGNPWIFCEIRGKGTPVTLQEWLKVVLDHLRWQEEEYGNQGSGAICMRKHLLWYARGWPGSRKLRDKINTAEDLKLAEEMIRSFAKNLAARRIIHRLPVFESGVKNHFVWDPKWDMDRNLDRGIGEDSAASCDL